MSFRSWVTVVTIILLATAIFLGWHDIVGVWSLLAEVNLWILILLIPIQLFSYFATGNIIFSYLRTKGHLKDSSPWTTTRMALELNFVNHIIPSGGAAGFSYLGWVLTRHGVSAGRSTMAQIVRFAMTFVAFLGIMALAVAFLILDHHVDRIVIFVGIILVSLAIAGALFLVYIIGNHRRLIRFSDWITKISNKVIAFVSRKKEKKFVDKLVIEKFFGDLHQDYLEIRHDKKILKKPLMWSIFVNLADTALLIVVFTSLGVWVNPAILFIAFGTSSIASIVSVLPAGAGVYEAVMIGFLTSAGVQVDIAVAGTLLGRVTLVVGTILFGYLFYQLTILKYGKRPTDS